MPKKCHKNPPDTDCKKCGCPYDLREGCEPTPYCDECAQEILAKLLAKPKDSLASALDFAQRRLPCGWTVSVRILEGVDVVEWGVENELEDPILRGEWRGITTTAIRRAVRLARTEAGL